MIASFPFCGKEMQVTICEVMAGQLFIGNQEPIQAFADFYEVDHAASDTVGKMLAMLMSAVDENWQTLAATVFSVVPTGQQQIVRAAASLAYQQLGKDKLDGILECVSDSELKPRFTTNFGSDEWTSLGASATAASTAASAKKRAKSSE
jgi:hypothetical protein